MVTETYP